MKWKQETFEIIWLDFSSQKCSSHISICIFWACFMTLKSHWLIVIPNFSQTGYDSFHYANQRHTAHPVINLNWQCDIGFPPCHGINSFFLSSVKSRISLTRLERLDHLLWVIMKRQKGQTHSLAKMTSCGVGSLAVSIQSRNDDDDLYAFQSMADKSLCLTNQ